VIEVQGLRHPIVENALKVTSVAVVVMMMIMMMVVENMIMVGVMMMLEATTAIDYRVQAAYVPNDFTLGQDCQSLAVITGPNMGGKY
jgi:DNA mismatch repair ATPase MutS